MKRVALLCLGLALGTATIAEAQLTMQMSNGWSFTFAGNVNAFALYDDVSDGTTATPGGVVPTGDPLGGKGAFGIRTGLLPAFAVFDAKGKEGETDLSVHFGFAPQIQCGYGTGSNSVNGQGHDCFGAQIDMRQVFLTVGGSWGQILAGRELGLFGRQAILSDQTLFGVGATGGPTGNGTTLGRIGFGYIYPQFKAQMTYSTVGWSSDAVFHRPLPARHEPALRDDAAAAGRGGRRLELGQHEGLGRRIGPEQQDA